MASPIPDVRLYNFNTFSINNPNTQQPGVYLDAEFNQVVTSVNSIIASLAQIQRTDGQLANMSVGPDQVQAALVAGINPPTAWVSGTAYVRLNSVIFNNAMYYCAISHTASASFVNDLAAGDWTFIFNVNTGLVDITNQISNYASQGATATYQTWTLAGTGAQTVFTITGAVLTQSPAYLVHINGVYQSPTTYTVTANTITFTSAPANASVVLVECIGYPRAGFNTQTLNGNALITGTTPLSALSTQAALTLLGNATAGVASPTALTGAQALTVLGGVNVSGGLPQLITANGLPSLPALDASNLINVPNPAVSGTGVIGIQNFVLNGNAETGVGGWATYQNTAAATPVNGTGGTVAGVTFVQTTTNPIAGTASFQLTKDAVNRQGEGVSYDFVIDRANMGKTQMVQATLEVNVGSFSAGDIACFIYDKTNNNIITPVANAFPAMTIGGSPNEYNFNCKFSTVTTSNQYRLIFHIVTTSTSSFALNMDSIQVSPLLANVSTSINSLGQITFSSSGTYTPNAKMAFCIMEGVGGGGGGGASQTTSSTQNSPSGSGSGGGYFYKLLTAAQVGANAAITIGSAGTGSTTPGAAGGNGGNTTIVCAGTFGSTLTASGGGGGAGGALVSNAAVVSVAGGSVAGGTASNGDKNIPGQSSTYSLSFGTTGLAVCFPGGDSVFGRGGLQANNSAGASGVGFGSGGSGGISNNGFANHNGGNGAPGLVYITEFITN